LNVILIESYGMTSGFLQGAIGSNIRIAANFHILVQGSS
jgi:hypothetical protein